MIIDIEPIDLVSFEPLAHAIRRAAGLSEWVPVEIDDDGCHIDGVWHDASDSDEWYDFVAREFGDLPGPAAPGVLELDELDLDPTPYEQWEVTEGVSFAERAEMARKAK